MKEGVREMLDLPILSGPRARRWGHHCALLGILAWSGSHSCMCVSLQYLRLDHALLHIITSYCLGYHVRGTLSLAKIAPWVCFRSPNFSSASRRREVS